MKPAIAISFLIFISIVSAIGQTPGPSPKANPERSLSKEDALREVVFLSILKRWTDRKDLRLFYLGVDENQDLSKLLLTRLQDKFPNIRNDSDCYIDRDSSVVNDETGERGVRFSISKIAWLNGDKAKVSAGSYVGNMGSDGCDYTLERKKGSWEITLTEKCWIS